MRKRDVPSAETVQARLTGGVLVLPAGARAGEAKAALARARPDFADAVFIADAAGRLAGQVATPALFALADAAPLAGAMTPALTLPPEADQEIAAEIAYRHGAGFVAVVGADGALRGVLTPATLIDILHHEHEEDIRRLAGIGGHRPRAARPDKHGRRLDGGPPLDGGPLRRARQRLPWLLVGLAGSFAAAGILARFEATLAAHVAIAFFIPAIVYLADAIGTQTEAVVVRGLSRGHMPLGHILAGELAVGALIGGALAVLALPLAYWMFGSAPLALAVSLAIFAAGSVATTVGLVLPWLLSHRGLDPAYGSGPLATIVQDVLSVAIYLGIVAALM